MLALTVSAMPLIASAADADGYTLDDLGLYRAITKWTYNTKDTKVTPSTNQYGVTVNQYCGSFTNEKTSDAYLGDDGDALEMRLKLDEADNEKLEIDATDNLSHRFHLVVTQTNVQIYLDGSETDSKSIDLTGEWITYLVVNNNSGYDVYYKKDTDSKYTELISTTESRTELASQRGTVCFTGDFYVDYVQRYEKLEAFEDLVKNWVVLREDTGTGTDGSVWKKVDGEMKIGTSGDLADIPSYPLGTAGDAFEVKFNIGTKAFNINAFDSSGNHFNIKIMTYNGWSNNPAETKVVSGNNSVNLTTSAVVNDLVEQDVTALIVNGETKFDVYYKLDGWKGYEPLASVTKQVSGTTNKHVNFATSSSGTYDVKYVKYYTNKAVAESETKKADCIEIYNQDFEGSDIKGETETKVNDAVTTATVNSGSLSVAAGQETRFLGVTIPDGGYIEFKFKGDSSLTCLSAIAYDGTRQIANINLRPAGKNSNYLNDAKGAAEASNAWPSYSSYVGHTADTWHTYRIVRDGTKYSAYHNVDGSLGWVKQIENAATDGREDSTPVRFNLTATDGTAWIDYIKVYSPAGADGLLVTDGSYKTQEVTTDAKVGNDLRAVVYGAKGELIFAGYDANDKLVSADVLTVDGKTDACEKHLNTTALGSGVKTVRVFLWDSVTGLKPVTGTVRSVKVN